MRVEFSKSMDVGQGYNFQPDEHHTFGYITKWAIGDNDIGPDINVVDPNRPDGGFTHSVVSVLTGLNWSTLPNENITLDGRVSLANVQTLNMLGRQVLKRVFMQIGIVVYEYDLVHQVYFTTFKTLRGVTPGHAAPALSEAPVESIYALLDKTSGSEFGIRLGAKAEEDPLGIRNHTLELTLIPPIGLTPQQVQLQTSTTDKLIRPWGLPQT